MQAGVAEVSEGMNRLRAEFRCETERVNTVLQQKQAVQSQLASAQATNSRLQADLTAANAALHRQVLLMPALHAVIQ